VFAHKDKTNLQKPLYFCKKESILCLFWLNQVEKFCLWKMGAFLIEPTNEHWDIVLLIRQNSVDSFLAFESNHDYMKDIGHRTAALEDSRLLPLVENEQHEI
jgi:hypothetical protein